MEDLEETVPYIQRVWAELLQNAATQSRLPSLSFSCFSLNVVMLCVCVCVRVRALPLPTIITSAISPCLITTAYY